MFQVASILVRLKAACQAVSSTVRQATLLAAEEGGLMSHEASDEFNPCVEPALILSAAQAQEVGILKYWYKLVDPRPDPGIYRNADADGAARDVVELYTMFSFADSRAFINPWVPYDQEEDLFEEQ